MRRMEEVDEFKALGSMEAELECRVHAELERYTMQLENVRQEHDKPKDDYTFRAPSTRAVGTDDL